MDHRLNRAACLRRRLMAVCLATYSAGDLFADSGYSNRSPQRISAPLPTTNGVRSEQVEAQDLFVREPRANDTVPTIRNPENLLSIAGKQQDNRLTRLSSSRRAASISQADFTPIEIDDDDWSALMKSTLRVESEGTGILPGFSTASLRQSAAMSLDESTARLTHRASLSAAAAAIDALRLIGQSIDTSHGDGLATTGIESSLVAIREAQDFVGRYGHIDTGAISRMVRSHETKVLKDFDTSQLTGIIAADVYLDSARQTLSSIAIADPLAAHAIALLAKSYRQRATETPLALATSVHLMRAAASAVPDDRGLAIELASVLEQAKLYAESQTVMAKAMRISSPNEMRADFGSTISVVSGKDDGVSSTKQAIQIEQLSPELFASVSRPEGGPTGHDSAGSRAAKATESATEPAMEGNPVSRAFKSMTRMWR